MLLMGASSSLLCFKKSAYFDDYVFDYSNGEYQINTIRFQLLDGHSDKSIMGYVKD